MVVESTLVVRFTGFRVYGLGISGGDIGIIGGSGFGVWGLGFRVWGLRV